MLFGLDMKRTLFSAGALSFAALLLCACLPTTAAIYIAVIALATALLLIFFARHTKWCFSAIICLALCSLVVTRFYITSIQGPKACEDLIGKTATITATVTTEPQFNGEDYVYSITTDSVEFPNAPQNMNLNLYIGKKTLSIGDRFKSTVKFYEIPDKYKPSYYGQSVYLYSYPKQITKIGETDNFLTFSGKVSSEVNKCIIKNLPNEVSGILIGLITGGSYYLDDATYIAFKGCGLSHIISVSGMHMALLSSAVMIFSSLFGFSKKAGFLLCIPLLVLYAAISGFCPSAIRSVIMIAAVFCADLFYLRGDSLNILGVTAIAMLLVSPYLIYNLSFLLSFLAMTGILLSVTVSQKLCGRINAVGAIGEGIESVISLSVATVFANLATLPLVLLIWEGVSTVSVIANLAISFVVSFSLIFGMVLTLITMLFGSGIFISFLWKPLEYLLWYIRSVAINISNIPFSYIKLNVTTLAITCSIICLAVAFYMWVRKLGIQRIIKVAGFATAFIIITVAINIIL